MIWPLACSVTKRTFDKALVLGIFFLLPMTRHIELLWQHCDPLKVDTG